MPVEHYENFPVGSLMLPRRLRRPVHAIYAFARTADDLADEGEADAPTRLRALAALEADLARIGRGEAPVAALMQRLQTEAIAPFAMPLLPFYDLISAFRQDVSVSRYAHFGDVVDYCRRSANPVGRMMLHLYGESDARSMAQSDGICTALQLINFCQDVALDWRKGRVYLPQDEMAQYGVSEAQLAEGRVDMAFRRLMARQCARAHAMLKAGSPLGKTLKGRIGFELRLIILGGQRILARLEEAQYDVFNARPTLGPRDWWLMLKRACLQR